MDAARVTNSINHALKEIRDTSEDAVARAAEQAGQMARGAAEQVDKAAHRNPWYFVGSTAALAALAGFFLGRKTKI